MRIIVTAGGTGGHIYPALAIIEKFRAKEPNLAVLYIGTHNRMEKDLVPKHNIDYIPLEIYGLSKAHLLRNIKNLFLIPKALKKTEVIMREFQPDIVIGVGGYVTYPVIKVAKKLGIKTLIHEQNVIPGKANKAVAKHADLIATSFPESAAYFKKGKKVVYSGHPNGVAALKVPASSKSEFGLHPNSKLVTIVGGSLGSSSLNNTMKTYLREAANQNYYIIYITGSNLYAEFMADFTPPANVKVLPFYDSLPSLLKITDVLISRAGAGIIAEFLSLKVPTILIPSPHVANNHQYYNTLEIKKQGTAFVIEEKHLNVQNLTININKLLTNKEALLKMQMAQEKVKTPDSLEIIYQEIKRLLS